MTQKLTGMTGDGISILVHGMCNFSDLPLYVCSIDYLFATRCLHKNLQGDDALAGEFDDYVVLNCCDESGNCETGERRGSYEKWAWF